MRVRGLLGAGAGNSIQSSVSNVYGGFTASGDAPDLASTLSSYCVAGSDCNAAIQSAQQAYAGMGPNASAAVLNLASGNGVGAASAMAPLIGGALGATVGGPLGAAIGASVAASVESIFSGLFGSPPPATPVTCTYVLWAGGGGPGLCFQNPVFAPGPTDPTTGKRDSRWITFEEVMNGFSAKVGKQTASWQLVSAQQVPISGGAEGNVLDQVLGGFSYLPSAGYNATLRGSLLASGITLPGGPNAGENPYYETPDPSSLVDSTAFKQTLATSKDGFNAVDVTGRIAAFVSVYAQAYMRGVVELLINNRAVDPNMPLALLEATVQAWNVSHSDSATYTFDPNNSVASFVDAVIQNMIPLPPSSSADLPQANGGYAQRINVGPPLGGKTEAKPGAPMGAGAKAALWLGGTAVLAAGGVGVWAYVTQQTYSEALSRIGSAIWDQGAKSGGLLVDAHPLKGARLLGASEPDHSCFPEGLQETKRPPTHVQSVLFPRSKWSPSRAKRYAKSHGWKYSDVDVTTDYIHLRQAPPVHGGTYATIPYGRDGILARIVR